MNWHSGIIPLESPVKAERQAARRHYGVHPYFTRRPPNVVRRYILHYSREHDVVLDPFGGSGVTAVEAFLENRVGVQNDINPLASFIARGIADLSKGQIAAYAKSLDSLREECEKQLMSIQRAPDVTVAGFRKKVRLPPNVELPRSADVRRYYDLFSPHQLVSLAILRQAIDRIPDRYAGRAMLLAWSATLAKLNKTFLSAVGRAPSRGGSSIFSIYRYKVAKEPVELSVWPTFCERASNIIAAKREIDKTVELKRRTSGWFGRFESHARDVEDLCDDFRDAVDYIFTDPPYGRNIAYIDLSVLWNAWIGQLPDLEKRQKELIVGGDLGISESTYLTRLGDSIRACIAMLKVNRWLSVVFQHWNTLYFEEILCAAAEAGADLRAAVSQVGDPIWSMHKKKGDESVLAGELILTFHKTGKRKAIRKDAAFDLSRVLGQILSDMDGREVYGEYLFNRVIIEAWNRSAIGSLRVTKEEFTRLLRSHGWRYDQQNHYWVSETHMSPTLFGRID